MSLITFVVIVGSRTQSRIIYCIWLSSLSSLLILNRSTALYIYLYLVIHYTDISRVMRSDILYDFPQSDLSDYSFKTGFSLNILNPLNLAFFHLTLYTGNHSTAVQGHFPHPCCVFVCSILLCKDD